MAEKCWGHQFNHAEGCVKPLPHGPHDYPEPPVPAASSISQVMDYLAENSNEFMIMHNPHHGYYDDIIEYLTRLDIVEDEEIHEVLEKFNDELWVMQIYPRTPISFVYFFKDNFKDLILEAFYWLIDEHERKARADNPPLPEYGPLTEFDTIAKWIKEEYLRKMTVAVNQTILYGDGTPLKKDNDD